VKKRVKKWVQFGPTLWVGGRGRSKSGQKRENPISRSKTGFDGFGPLFRFLVKKVQKVVTRVGTGFGPLFTFCRKAVKKGEKPEIRVFQVFDHFSLFRHFLAKNDQNREKTKSGFFRFWTTFSPFCEKVVKTIKKQEFDLFRFLVFFGKNDEKSCFGKKGVFGHRGVTAKVYAREGRSDRQEQPEAVQRCTMTETHDSQEQRQRVSGGRPTVLESYFLDPSKSAGGQGRAQLKSAT